MPQRSGFTGTLESTSNGAPHVAPQQPSPPVPSAVSPRKRKVALLQEILRHGWSPATWPRSALLRLLLVFALLTVCSWAGIVLSRQSDGVATIWLSNGLLFGLLITQPPRRWLAYFAAGLCADTLADMLYGDPFLLAIGVSLANSIEVVTASLLLTLRFGAPLDLSRRRPLIGFLLIAVVGATALSSILGAAWTVLFSPGTSWWQMVRTWYLGDLLGIAILAPLIVILQRPAFFSMLRRNQLPHTGLVLTASALVTILVFLHNDDPLIFFLFPALLLVAFRLGFPGTVLNLVLTALLAIGFTVKGHGPLMLITGQHMLLHRIVIAQIFVAVAIFTMFPVTALLEEQQALKLSLAASERSFRSLALADELTGLSNRRAFNLHLENAWADALLNGKPLALVLLDADLFKQYNDVHGHVEGDLCLRALAAVLPAVIGTGAATASRFGGEEFAVILPHADTEEARRVAEAIRQAAAAKNLPHPGTPSGIQTVSLGVAALVPRPGQSATDLIQLADTALYAAKIHGRNRVSCA